MRAFVIEGAHTAEVKDVPNPCDSVPAGWAAVKVRTCGICGSDLHAYEGSQPFFIYPGVPGHEVVGDVVAINPSPDGPMRLKDRPIEQDLSVGDRVVLDPSVVDGTCLPCRTGRYNCCAQMRVLGVHLPGALADYYIAPLECLHRVPQGMTDELAALVEPVSIGVQIANRGRVSGDDTVLIVGAGTIGLCVAMVAAARGARVAMTDLVDARLEAARDLGADLTINPRTADLEAALAEFTDGDGPAVVIEAVGTPATYRSAIELAAPSGRVVLAGLLRDEVHIPGSLFVRKELDILGSRLHGGTIPQAVQLIASGAVNPGALITATMPLERTEDGLKRMAAEPERVLKILVEL